MTYFNPYKPDDNALQIKNYKEFKLDQADEQSLKDIEKNLEDGKIDPSNKSDILEYLSKLYIKISEIKKNEYAFEGENNFNVNEYLQRIALLKMKIERL